MASFFSQLTHTDYITLHPKLELHAHISGSINENHLLSLMKDHWTDQQEYDEKLRICKLSPDNHHDTRDLDECFELFKVLHHIIDSQEVIHMVTLQVLEDFVFRDHATYVELRTTPRPITKDGVTVVTMEGYMSTVVGAIREFRMIMAFLAQKYKIETILSESGITIEFHSNIEQYSVYGQQILRRFDSFFDQSLQQQNTDQVPKQHNSLSLFLETSSNPIPLPLSSPISPHISTDMANRIDTNSILTNHVMSPRDADSSSGPIAHYHSNKYTLSSIALSISSFVSVGILFSFDRASFTHDACQELLSTIEKLRNEDETDQRSPTPDTPTMTQFPVPNSVREIIVGLDFSGNPFAKNLFNHFLPFWERAVEMGLSTSIHFAETKNETDSMEILTFGPGRLGHAAVLNQTMRDAILNCEIKEPRGSKMGIEVCLSSNKACKLQSTIKTHPVVGWIEYNNTKINQYFKDVEHIDKNENGALSFPSLSHYPDLMSQLIPVTLCTDDSGVFSCSLVDEWLQLLSLAYFNHHAKPQHDTDTFSPDGIYTYPINSLIDPTAPTATVSITPGEQVLSFKNTDGSQQLVPIPRSKFDDFIRINNFAQTGIQSIFQKQYIPIIYRVFEKFRPVK